MTFTEWLLQQTDDDTRFGDLARDVAADRCWPADAATWGEVGGHLAHHDAAGAAEEVAYDAMVQWAIDTEQDLPDLDDDLIVPDTAPEA